MINTKEIKVRVEHFKYNKNAICWAEIKALDLHVRNLINIYSAYLYTKLFWK